MPCCSGFWRVGIHLLPLSVAIFLPASFLITYAVAVYNGHVEAGFPYIRILLFFSDTGAYSPESCLFGQLLNIGALLVLFTIHIRYKQVLEYYTDTAMMNTIILRMNKVSLVCGYFAALGLSIVGNFQENHVLVVHLIGAILAFGVGMIYAYLQSVMSYKMYPHVSHLSICHTRLLLSILVTVFFVMTYTFDAFAKKSFHGKDPRKWYPEDGGFVEHVVSTASEWAMSISMMCFFLTFVGEFQRIHVRGPAIVILDNDFNPLDNANSISTRIA